MIIAGERSMSNPKISSLLLAHFFDLYDFNTLLDEWEMGSTLRTYQQ